MTATRTARSPRSARQARPARRPAVRTAWGVLARGWPWFVGAVLLDALAQAGLVTFDLTPRVDSAFLIALLVSVLVAAGALAVIVAAAAAGALGFRFRIHVRTLLSSLVVVVLVAAATIGTPPAGVAVAVLGMLVLPMIDAEPTLDAIVERFLGLRFRILRTIGWIVADVALIGLAWLASFHIAFFVSGAYAAFASWITTGAAVVMMQCGSGALLAWVERSRPSAPPVDPHHSVAE